MSRNKFPEETNQKILDVSASLFMEKGYDHTTIQDIVNALGMSKGAVYHHFKSKEDILNQINSQYYIDIQWFDDILKDPGLSGLDQLKRMLIFQLSDKRKLNMDSMMKSVEINPQLLSLAFKSSMTEAAPFMQKSIEKGIQDGSIHTDYPKELAEVFTLLLNLWIGISTTNLDDLRRKAHFLKEMTDKLGLPIIDDELLKTAESYFETVVF